VLDQQVFASSAVAELMNSKYVAVKINAEKEEGPKVAKEFGVRGFPTAVVVDAETGKEIDRIVGFRPPDAYLKTLKDIAGGNSWAAVEKKAKADPKDAEVWTAYARKLEEREKIAEAKAAWKKVLALDPDDKGPGPVARLGLARIEAGETRDPKPVIDFAKKYDGKPAALEAHELIVEMLGGSPGDDDEQKQLIDSYEYLVTHGKRDSETLNNYAFALALAKKDLEKALKMSRDALEAAPDAPHIMDTVAECLFGLGKKDEALAMERKALEKADPKNKQMVEIFKRKIAEWEGEGEKEEKEKEGDGEK
jgi:tetratricopeptide (TPR) repeat protein